ncbi:hypothetical protein [Nocardioides marinquilinus]
MAFIVTFRDEDGFGSQQFDDEAKYSIAENGVLRTTEGDEETRWSPGFWCTVKRTTPERSRRARIIV